MTRIAKHVDSIEVELRLIAKGKTDAVAIKKNANTMKHTKVISIPLTDLTLAPIRSRSDNKATTCTDK